MGQLGSKLKPKNAYFIGQDCIKSLDDTSRVPPVGRFDLVCHSRGGSATLGLNLANGSESTSGEGLFELANRFQYMLRGLRHDYSPGNAVVRVVVGLECSDQALTILLPLLLRGDDARWRRRAAQIVDVEVTYTDLGRRANAIPALGCETHDPWTGIINVDLCITGVNSGKGNSIPSAQFNQVLDGIDGDAKHGGIPGEE
jgi:hypothetical protein